MNAPTVDNRVAVLILQHPQEQDRALGTARLLCDTLANARLVVGLSWRNLGHAWGEATESKDWGVLYLGSARAAGRGPLVALDRKGAPLSDQEAARAGLRGIVVLDGNWSQAKTLWWRNPWLTRLRRFVIVPDRRSLYGDLRRETRPDAVSTLEAVALALAALEGHELRESLLAPLREMVAKARAAGIRDTARRDRRIRR